MSDKHFRKDLRAEYDQELMDADLRRKLAERLYQAMKKAGVWPVRPRILDVGCGSGLKLAYLGNDDNLRVGCDIRSELYLQARDRAGLVRFIQAQASQLPFSEGSFDMITCLSVIEELPDYRAAIAEMTRCVAPGGLLCITVTNGPLLKKIYTLVEFVGGRIRESWWAYARASSPIVSNRPDKGFSIDALAGWRYVHLTPFVIRGAFSFLWALPFPVLNAISCRLSPTHVHIWIRPLENERNRRCVVSAA
ncbi:MAG TPA: methyltransferase domain-containing protein [Syntrophales bacterium]|nr:methyltransferase domain-containing protein [Syntrophales bacterium]